MGDHSACPAGCWFSSPRQARRPFEYAHSKARWPVRSMAGAGVPIRDELSWSRQDFNVPLMGLGSKWGSELQIRSVYFIGGFLFLRLVRHKLLLLTL